MKRITITTTISTELHKDLKDNKVKISEALRVGGTYLLSNKLLKYQNKTQLRRKLEEKKATLINLLNEMLELKLRTWRGLNNE